MGTGCTSREVPAAGSPLLTSLSAWRGWCRLQGLAGSQEGGQPGMPPGPVFWVLSCRAGGSDGTLYWAEHSMGWWGVQQGREGALPTLWKGKSINPHQVAMETRGGCRSPGRAWDADDVNRGSKGTWPQVMTSSPGLTSPGNPLPMNPALMMSPRNLFMLPIASCCYSNATDFY